MKVREARKLIEDTYQRLNQKPALDKKGLPIVISLRLGQVEYRLLKDFCEKLAITQATFLRICVDHFETYLASLDEKQFLKELINIHKFESQRIKD